MSELLDREWALLKPALDLARSGRGRPLANERLMVEAIVWRYRNGAKWRSLPERFGPWWRPAQLHIRWSQLGVWERVFAYLRDAGQPDLSELFMDGSSIRAHRSAAGAKGGPRFIRSAAAEGVSAANPSSPATP